MAFSIVATVDFEKELKRLAKKYPSIKNDVAGLAETLLNDPRHGVPIGNECYKIRLAITSKGKGKSGGARVITHIQVTKQFLYMLSIYDKSEAENITDNEVIRRLREL